MLKRPLSLQANVCILSARFSSRNENSGLHETVILSGKETFTDFVLFEFSQPLCEQLTARKKEHWKKT